VAGKSTIYTELPHSKAPLKKGFSKKPRSITRGYRDEKIMFPFQMTMDWLGYTP
jgi:hypothetical protein